MLNKRQQHVYDELLATAPPNVQIVERVPFDQMDGYFQHARLFLNTSMAEGFPNAFLQAGKFGVPVASLHVDPDGMLSQHGCGTCAAGDMEQLTRRVNDLFADTDFHATRSAAIGTYVEQHHELSARVEQLSAAIERWLPSSTRKAA